MANLLSVYVYPFVVVSALLGFMGLAKGLSKFSLVGAAFMVSSTSVLLALRDPLAPADSSNYLWMYNEQNNFLDIFTTYHGNFFFSFTQYIGNTLNLSVEQFFILQTLSFYFLTLIGLRLIFKSNKMFLMSLSLFVLTSTFVLLYTNVVRQGLALSLILLSVGLFVREFRLAAYLLLILAVFSHFSAILVALIILSVRVLRTKGNYFFVLLIFLPLVPFLSQFFILNLAALGGLFQKIDTLSSKDYSNILVYIKVAILYASLCGFYYFGTRKQAFLNPEYLFIFRIYFFTVFVVFFTLPILLMASRFIYYASALLPILYTIVIFHRPNILSIGLRFFICFLMSLIFGIFVYSFNSTRLQLGI